MRDTEHIPGLPVENPWNVETESRLIELWADGRSASEIAKELGPKFSKDSVAGKVHRLDLPGRESPINKSDEPKAPAPGRYIDPNRRSLPPLPTVAAMAYVHRPAAPSYHHKCQYPSGETRPYLFCEAPVVPGKSYCSEHFDLCSLKRPPVRV